MGQGWGLDWSQFPDWIELLQSHWAYAALTAAVTAKDGMAIASGAYQRLKTMINAGADVLRKKIEEWRADGVHVSDISYLITDEGLAEYEKAHILGLTEAEVAQLRALLSPASEGIPPESTTAFTH
ncbi:hypothetical protein BJF80_09630 [Serinicoccus sp. CUA-874]|nr:hypothetical protein BJF80_09630 [Serinicoccus sp. CUA-874]